MGAESLSGELLADALDEADLVDATRDRAPVGLSGRDGWVTAAGAVLFAVAAGALIALGGTSGLSWPLLVAVVATYAAVSRIEFEVGSGSLVPTQLLLVPMLFVLPPAVVPAAVAVGLVIGSSVDIVRGRLHGSRLLVPVYYSSHSLGPAVVLVLAGIDGPSWSDWPVLIGALAAQFVLDLVSIVAREVFALGVRPRVLVSVLPSVYAMDALLSPIGFLAALAAVDATAAMFAVLPLALLFQLVAIERRQRIDRTVELSGAYTDERKAARTDGLTGVANRLAWEESLLEFAAQGDVPVRSVIVLDVNSLKQTNDTYGHEAGDQLIREVASTFQRVVGDEARLVARLGGDEFACVLDGRDAGECRRLVDELRAAIAVHPGVGGMPIAVSVGGASCPPERSLAAAIEEADRGVYEEKERARLGPDSTDLDAAA